MTRTETVFYAVGDVHGCYDKMATMIRKIIDHWRSIGEPAAEAVFLGDYVDRGPSSQDVMKSVVELQESGELTTGLPVTMLRGNHDDMMMHALLGDPDNMRAWLMNGGIQTLQSHRVPPDFHSDAAIEQMNLMRDTYCPVIEAMPTIMETDHYVFVHAGIMPGIPPQDSDEWTRLWIRKEFLRSDYEWGKIVVHGHTPLDAVEQRANRIGIDTGAVFGGPLTCAILEHGVVPMFMEAR